MVNILGTQTLNGLLILEVDANPSTDGGVEAPIGSFGSASDGSGFFMKTGALDTDWGRSSLNTDALANNVLCVEKVPTSGQFPSVESALAFITTNSATNRFLIKVGVGIFLENQLNMKSYVSVIGASIQETIIEPAGDYDLFVFTDVFSELSFMSLQNVPVGRSAVFCNDSGDYTQLHKVNFVDCDTNVKVVATTQDTVIYMEYCDVNGAMTYGTYQDGSSGFRAVINTENWYSFPSATGFTASFLTGPDSQLIINTAGIYGTPTIGAPPVAGNYGIVCQDGASITIDGAEISGFQTALQNNNTGIGCNVHITSASFDNNTMDINIQHPSTTGGFIGDATLSKIFIDNSSTFTPLFTEESGDGGLVVVGNISTGAKISEVVEITTFIGAQGVGLILGGSLSDGGSFDVDILAGVGYLNDGTLKKITWSNDSITLTADTTNYIYYDGAGALMSATSLPDTIANLLLGKVRTNATGIEFIDEIPLTALWADNKSDDYQRYVFGSLFQFGCIVSENATPFKLDVTNGAYYYGTKKFVPSGGAFITFDRFYQDSVSTYAIESAQTLVPNTQINTGYALVAMTASYYAKHLLLVVGEGANEKYFLVYAQAEYSTLLAAENADLPTVPTYFSEGVVRVASVIVQQGAGNIVEILSERPLPTTQTSASAPVTSHLALTDLTTGDAGHTQFLLLDGTTVMIGSLNMGTQNIINIGLLNGVTIETHASRHLPNGADSLTTAAPTTNLGGGSTNAVGIQNSFARSDHSHEIDIASTSVTGLLTSTDWNTFNNKLSTALASANIFVGSAGNIATAVVPGGVISMTNTGVFSYMNASLDLTTKVTGILPIANGGTNSATVLSNNRIIVSVAGAIVEHSVQTAGFVSFYGATGLPSGNSDFRYSSADTSLGLGVAPSVSEKFGITATGSLRGLFVNSASKGALVSTTHASEYSLAIENASATVTPINVMTLTKSGHAATIGSGLYQVWNDKVTTTGAVDVGKFGVLMTDVTAGTYKTKFSWLTPNQTTGTLVERMALTSNGVLNLIGPILTGYVSCYQAPNTANSNSVVSSTAEVLFTGTGIDLTIPANTLAVGDRIKVKVYGIYSRVSGTLTSRLKNNAVTMLATGARTMTTSTNVGFSYEAIITVRTIGAGGTVSADLTTLFDEGTFADGDLVASNGTHAIDTTISQVLTFSAQWSVSNAGNTITIENADWEIIKKS